jgi:hypothetical protein
MQAILSSGYQAGYPDKDLTKKSFIELVCVGVVHIGCRVNRRLTNPQQSRDAGIKAFKIPLMLKTDDAFHIWFSDVANLDAQEVLGSKDELASTFYLELPPEERVRRIEHLRQLGAWMNGGTIALIVGSFVLPDPGHVMLAALVVLPWVAICLVARFQPLYRFAGSRNDERVDLTLPLMLPGLILTWDALFTLNTLEWQGPLMLACAGGLVLTGVAARIDPWFRHQRWGVLAIGLFACAYGYGTGMELNALTDGSPPQVHRVRVLGKHVDESSHVSTWYLTLEPWGPDADSEDVSVSKTQYQLTKPGDTVCVPLKSGALKIAWYRVETCVQAGPQSTDVPGHPAPLIVPRLGKQRHGIRPSWASSLREKSRSPPAQSVAPCSSVCACSHRTAYTFPITLSVAPA